MDCHNCGQTLQADWHYCPNCGSSTRQLRSLTVRAHVVTPYIVGIHFGTENTSAYGRNPNAANQEESAKPISLLPDEDPAHDGHQMPSYIAYSRKDENLRPVVGHEAKIYYSQPGTWDEWEAHRDVLLWLRSDDPEQRWHSERWLRDFLSVVREQINAFLTKELGEIPVGVKYVILLPVLDQSEPYYRQRERMHEVLQEVYSAEIQIGLLHPDDFIFVHEPQAICANFLLGHVRLPQLHGFQSGDLFAVVDSGAGTTDIALVQVTAIGIGYGQPPRVGTYRFDILGLRGTRMGNNTSHSADELSEFGGRFVDEQVLDLMCRNAAIAETGSPRPAAESVEVMRQLVLEGIARDLSDELSDTARLEAAQVPLKLWVEDAKRELRSRDKVTLKDFYLVPGVEGLENYAVSPAELEKRLLPKMQEIVAAIKEIMARPEVQKRLKTLPPARRAVRFVLAVGDNSNEPIVEKYLRKEFDRLRVVSLNSPELRRLRVEAAVRGAVWCCDA